MSSKKFRLLIRGNNLWVLRDGLPCRLGFYTTRFVAASETAEAEVKAIADALRELRAKQFLVNDASDPPSLVVEEIDRLSDAADVALTKPGFAFFDDPPSRSM